MKSERLMGIVGTLLMRSGPVLALCLCTAAAVAATVHWRKTGAAKHRQALFSLVAHPLSRTVKAGGTARYTVAIHRGRKKGKIRYRGKIKLKLASVGPGLLSRQGARMGNRASLKVHGQRAVVTVKTVAGDKPGNYKVKLKAVGAKHKGYLTLRLKITAPQPASFNIAGSFGPLWPGTAQAVDLALTNPNSRAISVQSLTVSVKQVSAPRATPELPCSAADFAVSQFSGSYPLKIPAHATVHLSDLRVQSAQGPQLRMLDRPVNQDGCQGATLTLSYSGTATGP